MGESPPPQVLRVLEDEVLDEGLLVSISLAAVVAKIFATDAGEGSPVDLPFRALHSMLFENFSCSEKLEAVLTLGTPSDESIPELVFRVLLFNAYFVRQSP